MWSIVLNILCIFLGYAWDWFTGESDIYHPKGD